MVWNYYPIDFIYIFGVFSVSVSCSYCVCGFSEKSFYVLLTFLLSNLLFVSKLTVRFCTNKSMHFELFIVIAVFEFIFFLWSLIWNVAKFFVVRFGNFSNINADSTFSCAVLELRVFLCSAIRTAADFVALKFGRLSEINAVSKLIAILGTNNPMHFEHAVVSQVYCYCGFWVRDLFELRDLDRGWILPGKMFNNARCFITNWKFVN